VVLNPENRACLRRGGFVVYLAVSPELLFERTRHDRNRPLLQVADPLARLKELHAQRDPLYREVADLVVENPGSSAQAVAQYLLREFSRNSPEQEDFSCNPCA